ncbi:hypothetical protein Glove_197g106 [Diversispora epigaea]|uniref:Putative restriction endonuclease domain-containing protein n=1 Tax=Diversispora epigaea TaxID=1348612 RepID=A0A397G357_9GLOM|nr:hypothetical protein Glove_810674g2 [Diversispora epigaea]RHZ76491.1 hypothetical protein Glove_197g106 [Diversispora epigaea]
MSFYIPRLTIPDCDRRLFEKIAVANPRFYDMNLIDGQLEIIMSLTHNKTNQIETCIVKQVTSWCDNNENMIGHCGGPTGCFILPNGDVLGPDASVVLYDRWNVLSEDEKDETFPQVTPNFIVELRSKSSSSPSCHRKMLRWMDGGAEEGFLIDPIADPQTVKIYTHDANTNKIIWQDHIKPQTITSQVLTGFTMNMQRILW